jgi:TonB family protein
LEGAVIVTLIVEQDATLRDLHVSRSLGLGLDEKAIDAVRLWHFSAAMKDEQPVACLTRVEVNFRMLTARSDWYLTRTDFETRRNVARPVVLGAEFPAEIGTGETATAVISFDIDGQGSATDVRVDFISDEKWGPQLIAAMRSWKFQPSANKVHATFGFAAGQIRTAPSQLF